MTSFPEYDRLDATDLAGLIRRRELTPTELLDAAIERAAQRNPAINAITLSLFDRARQAARAETLSAVEFDLVALRAVERFATVLPTAAHLVAPAGRLALLIGSAQLDQAHASLSQLSWSNAVPIPGSCSRVLAVAHRPY